MLLRRHRRSGELAFYRWYASDPVGLFAAVQVRVLNVLKPVRLVCHLPAETGRGFAVTRICGGTGHIQRMVMAGQLLR